MREARAPETLLTCYYQRLSRKSQATSNALSGRIGEVFGANVASRMNVVVSHIWLAHGATQSGHQGIRLLVLAKLTLSGSNTQN